MTVENKILTRFPGHLPELQIATLLLQQLIITWHRQSSSIVCCWG